MLKISSIRCVAVAGFALCCLSVLNASAQAQNVVPHAQDRPPGPALSPQEAMAKMQLPPGFKVQLAAAEPDVVNPTAMTFDDRGRIWLTESIEYPRRMPGGGRDHVKILEDKDHDGTYETVKIFKEGLNIPCGVAIGNGGVYVTNSPDILFLKDTDGDDVADTQEVVLTGFGRADTHELPNSLTWGPDGWLYGMNGVFNPAKVKDPASGKVCEFTCAIWRYHPPTKRFEVYAEGTSNPWGLDFNRQGDWFISACVIDHLWHMTQSGYYVRQGGPYPPNTVPLESISTQMHQKAAYAGLLMYDAEVFPAQYRGKLLMGNLHGSCINVDQLQRNGSTYKQSNDPDFLSANDAWFMPVAEKLGPDGCVYLMDWYDRYHCYQDANRDSPGLDRLKGRIYRITYNDAPLAKPFNLAKSSNDELLKQLSNPNVWWRRTAQRLLDERFDDAMIPELQKLALSTDDSSPAPMHALWLLISQHKIDPAFHLTVLSSANSAVRKWGVRAVGEMRHGDSAVMDRLSDIAKSDPSPEVRLEIPIAAGRLQDADPMPLFNAMLANAANASDPLIPNILYQNLKPHAPEHGRELLTLFNSNPEIAKVFGNTVVRWMRENIAAIGLSPKELVAQLAPVLSQPDLDQQAAQTLQGVINALAQTSLQTKGRVALFGEDLQKQISEVAASDSSAKVPAIAVALWWDDANALDAARAIVADPNAGAGARSQLLKSLAERNDPANFKTFAAFITDDGAPLRLRKEAVDALGTSGDRGAVQELIASYPKLSPELKPAVINALARDKTAASAMLDAIEAKTIPVGDINPNQVRQINGFGDKSLADRVTKLVGAVKTERDPARVQVVEKMRESLRHHEGNELTGQAVFTRICAQCHTIYGKGGSVGPDLTGVGRENLDAILTNVLDPNLVIGASYFINIAKMTNGTVASGVLVEQSDSRVVLKDGTKTYTLNRANVKELVQQKVSMMPEGLENTMSEQDFADLVAFLLTREAPASTQASR